jgi:iron complex outermembrane receptor protein
LAPELSAAFFFNKSVKIQHFDVAFDLISSYQTKTFFESSNRPDLAQDAYWLTDVSIKLSKENSPWKVEIYADNLLDEDYIIDAGNTGGGFGLPTFVAGMPFIAGVRVYADF